MKQHDLNFITYRMRQRGSKKTYKDFLLEEVNKGFTFQHNNKHGTSVNKIQKRYGLTIQHAKAVAQHIKCYPGYESESKYYKGGVVTTHHHNTRCARKDEQADIAVHSSSKKDYFENYEIHIAPAQGDEHTKLKKEKA